MNRRYRIDTLRVDSEVLAKNPLGDPATRELPLLVPEGADPATPLPLVFVLVGYSGVGRQLLTEDDRWSESFRQRVERLAAEGRVGPMIYAFPDGFTRYGGAQYIDSPAVGDYDTWLWRELLPAVRAHHPVSRVGVAGKSSGGYGALVAAMRHPDLVSAVACHSGDLAFEYAYLPHVPALFRALRQHGGLEPFLAEFAAASKKRSPRFFDAIQTFAMAACYSPDPTQPRGVALPIDLDSGELLPDVWARWLAHDPVRMVEQLAALEALRKQRLVYLDCGSRDEYHLDLGARMLAARLRKAGVAHRHEEFDDGHSGTAYRYDVSLPLLSSALRD